MIEASFYDFLLSGMLFSVSWTNCDFMDFRILLIQL